jgi:hypothetical protein
LDSVLGLTSRNSVARKSTKKIAIKEPYRVSIVVSVVAVVVVNVFVMNMGLGIETDVSVVVLVSVRSE